MKKVFIKHLIVLLFFPAAFISCFDNETDLAGYGDAYILVEQSGEDTLKGLGLHAFSYSAFSSVVVTLSGNSSVTYTLDPYEDYPQDYIWTTPLAQYTQTLPPTGSYVFNATFTDGQSLLFSDNLTAAYLQPPKIKSCQYVKQTARVSVEWETVKNADAYNVKLLNTEGEYLFVSPAYNSTITNYSFSTDSQGWQSSDSYPVDGQVVIVELAAYLLEPQGGSDELQSISKSRIQISWGTE